MKREKKCFLGVHPNLTTEIKVLRKREREEIQGRNTC